ncbi:LAMI_0E13036g1_1 [Lachancea mirantina]|uniref:LAMI_0E13036g1_1 n=1 Tax=Lachancea mirantina TaxID=1230905 RepID=A0A1G4JQK7_9SACH|nr:LAMI_0E13036g1_1 [Lachancea mirantina]
MIPRVVNSLRAGRPFKFDNGQSALKWTIGLGTVAVAAATATGFMYHNRTEELSQNKFIKYRVSYNKPIDQDHFFLELSPLKRQKTNIWTDFGANKLWSVEVKQPQIMVARSYTPLPLEHTGNDQLRVLSNNDFGEGKLFFYIKRYSNGEVARWLSGLPVDHIVEIRGPYADYVFPNLDEDDTVGCDRRFLMEEGDSWSCNAQYLHRPFDISMFTAGTGIVTALQLALKPNPFQGNIMLFHSCGNLLELGPLANFLIKLQLHGKLQLHLFESQKNTDLRSNIQQTLSMIPPPSVYDPEAPFENRDQFMPVLSLVCGSSGYISTVAGPMHSLEQGPVEGLLKQREWTDENVYKLN